MTQEIIDLMENKLTGCAATATTSIGAFIIHHPKVCVAAGDFKRSILQGANHSYQLTKERVSKGAAWFDRQCVRNPQCAVAGAPGVTIDMGENFDTHVFLSESTQSAGDGGKMFVSKRIGVNTVHWEVPENLGVKKPFKQKRLKCVKNEQKICQNNRSLFVGCHKIDDLYVDMDALIKEIRSLPNELREIAIADFF